MNQELVQAPPAGPLADFADRLPPMIAGADDRTGWRFIDFFAVTIRNPNTRESYYRAVSRFLDWSEDTGLHSLRCYHANSRGRVRRTAPALQGIGPPAPLGDIPLFRLAGLRWWA